ncbi:MAG: glutamate--tRNA ligase [Chitinophagaceae bacterium]|nr:glutamate--tRNA ligase [Chitinophagaceae bacterium]
MENKVRVRFAPSPTGGLHLGGVRTVLYNYLFAKKLGGDFILRIEDTDQSRFVPGAEGYIFECLKWCGIEPDESAIHGGDYGPYRQSERKRSYLGYAEKLVENGYAYYAFDTPEELEAMRQDLRTADNPAPQYDQTVRGRMRNSISLPADETKTMLLKNTPHVIRIKLPDDEIISFQDMIRGEVHFNTGTIDDKVLLKADGMPTYHLAVVVDDFLMKITHAFRGEEWLPSSPVHVLLWRYLFGEKNMPQWAHLPLIMGPSGKLSKRDGAKYGFPVFAMNWTDPATNELTEGFKEKGFLPEAFLNMLAMLGWNDGTEQEVFSITDLIQKFSIERVHKAGAKFDYEKAKWFNHEWIKGFNAEDLRLKVKNVLEDRGLEVDDTILLDKVINLVKDRCTLLTDFYDQAYFFFRSPATLDIAAVRPKWTMEKKEFFISLCQEFEALAEWESAFIESAFKTIATEKNIKPGELQLPFRIMLVGGKFGPPVFDIAGLIGKQETIHRIMNSLEQF